MDFHLTQEQKQQLSQNQIQSLKILAMDSMELREFMRNEYLENPVLEYQKDDSDLPPQTRQDSGYILTSHTGDSAREELKQTYEIPDRAKDSPSIKEYLMNQLPKGRYTSYEYRLIEYMIESLDSNGFFTEPEEETARINHLPTRTVSACLEDLRQLEPCGIFSAGLRECLLYQAGKKGILDQTLEQIIRNHLEDIADGKISNITRALKINTAAARKYITAVKTLNPRPLAGFTPGETQYIVPDIILSRQDGQWEIRLNDDWTEDYRISDYYLRMMDTTRDEQLRNYFRMKLNRAKLLLKNVEQRRSTILAVSQAVLEWQTDYFTEQGPLKPMTMTEIAKQIGMHTSTVSRSIQNKYIQSPRETLLFKHLFSLPATASKGNRDTSAAVTSAHIKMKIRDIIASEDPTHPYSDQALSEKLKKEGISVSRRTVAKYREELHIAGSFLRK